MQMNNHSVVKREIELFVPGRLCLFGEHTDWVGRYTEINAEVLPGHAIVTGIDLGIYATVKKNETFHMRSYLGTGEEIEFECEMNVTVLRRKAMESHYFCYVCGVAAYMLEHYRVGGISIRVDKITLPIKKGLSSSAAVCVLAARAFNEIYQLKMSVNGEMQAAYRGEMLTPSRCGRLDQACAYGIRPVSMEFDGNEIRVEKLNVGKELYWVFADLMEKKDTVKILSDLNKCYPFARTQKDKDVHSAFGIKNQELIEYAEKAIANGDAKEIGRIMEEAQALFDTKVAPACPEELAAPKLHSVLNDAMVRELSYGGKGVGSQGDGTVQFIAKDKQSQKRLVEYLNSVLNLHAYSFTLPSRERVRKAIIPLAGFGTRMYPATRFIKKAFMPVIDETDTVKPVIMYLFEELDTAGIEEIILIVGEDEEEEFQKLFNNPLSEEHIEKLPEKVRDYERFIAKISNKLRFVIQRERKGFGHAVYQARELLGKEPVLLLLGDFIYRSNLSTNCAEQTMNAYIKSNGQTVVAIKKIPLEDVVHYGVLTGTFDSNRNYLMNVSNMVEKPRIEYAKDYLGVKNTKGVDYYATFGQYVLTLEVFELLEREINENNDGNEISLTNALHTICQTKGITGVCVDGESYDVGIPKAYRETVTRFGR